MVEMNEMGELVRSHIIDQRERRLHQAPVKPDMATLGTAAPLRLRVGKRKTAGGTPQSLRDTREPPG